jgi:hypothetical protein
LSIRGLRAGSRPRRVGKAPIKLANGTAIGVLGMYVVVDAATGRSLFMKSMKGDASAKV